MWRCYHDILDTLGEPQWFDEAAVPRYCPFAPDQVANIYAEEACLVQIACQACHRKFRVAFSYSHADRVMNPCCRRLSEQIRQPHGFLHYGDPPNVECCACGPTMNSEPERVLEFWIHDRKTWTWERHPELEKDFEAPAAGD
jgi:hypothetical protein